jgi:tetratricopeptide (TPR) repeat protein
MPEMNPIRFGKYLLMESIATGGVAQLFLSKITGLQGFEKLVAIKMILPHLSGERDLVKAFIDEAKVAALLSHPNIVQIYDFGLMENSYFIAMEYLFGKDLRHIFQKAREKEAPLSLEHALYITARICSGLGYAHKLTDLQGNSLHLIHRDISPQNILITYGGEVKLVDFGIAKAAGQSSTTQHGSIKGKVAYMSPEQASGEKIDQRSDIFSAGILLYEMLTQKRMFTGDTMEILDKVRKRDFEPAERLVENLPPMLYKILERALAKDVNQRYQSCGEMQGAVEECMFDLSLRPDAQALGEYMKKLFGQEMEAEGERICNESACLNAGQEGEALGKDLQFMEEILQKAKAISAEEETATLRKSRVLYGALGGSVLLIAVLVWALLFRGTPMNAADKGTLEVASVQPAANPVTETPSGKSNFSERVQSTDKAAQARGLVDKATGLIEKNPGEAKSLLQKAVELDPRSADAYFNLGYVYAVSKNYLKAEEMYSQTVKLSPPYLDEALFNLALVQEKQGKNKQSMKSLERAIKINPQNEMAQKLLKKLKGVS